VRRNGTGRVLTFRSAEALARLAAEARLVELLTEAGEIEAWISEAQNRQHAWALSYAAPRHSLASIRR